MILNTLSYIVWDPAKEMFRLPFNDHPIVWYGLLFAMGFIIGQQLMFYIFNAESKPKQDVETLTLYMVIATVVGARLGHCLFYDPAYYLSNPLDILKVWEGGLASHGAAVGILTGIYLYSRKKAGQSYLWVVDRVVIIVALAGALIRFGNFINSEIVGLPTESSSGVVFARSMEELASSVDFVTSAEASKAPASADTLGFKAPVLLTLEFDSGSPDEIEKYLLGAQFQGIINRLSNADEAHIKPPTGRLAYQVNARPRGITEAKIIVAGNPRHPAQLYESISCLLLFLGLLYLWSRKKQNTPEGLIFSIFLIVVFGLRFVYEFLKENQVDFEDNIPLNMGQWLSIPLVAAGIVILIRVLSKARQGTGS